MELNEAVSEIARVSFKQTLGTLSFSDQLNITQEESLELDSKKYFSVLTTVSTSDFRVSVLLHVPRYTHAGGSLSQFMTIDDKGDQHQQYIDHVYEYSNSLCGMSARHIQKSGYTTGISQPAVLNRVYTDIEIDSLSPSCKAHVCSTIDGELSLCASICIFLNDAEGKNVCLQVEDENEFEDISGELEFF